MLRLDGAFQGVRLGEPIDPIVDFNSSYLRNAKRDDDYKYVSTSARRKTRVRREYHFLPRPKNPNAKTQREINMSHVRLLKHQAAIPPSPISADSLLLTFDQFTQSFLQNLPAFIRLPDLMWRSIDHIPADQSIRDMCQVSLLSLPLLVLPHHDT